VSIDLRALARADLPAAKKLLRKACASYRADEVAEEKLFGPALGSDERPLEPTAYGAFENDRLVGVAAASGEWIRLLAVLPGARGQGIGTVLLAAVESVIASSGTEQAQTLAQPGNYLAPGIDALDTDTIGWMERRGYARGPERHNLEIDVATNPRVNRDRAREIARKARAAGYAIRRATREDTILLRHDITQQFSRGWAFEVEHALSFEPAGVHIALRLADGALAAFAAHDGNNQGLGWFGPAGTFEEHRRLGLGEALLVACLIDVADAGLPTCTIAWIGPRHFYDRVAGVSADRFYVVMRKDLRSQ
jgi:GNAT superfamily N-acetyltransferase